MIEDMGGDEKIIKIFKSGEDAGKGEAQYVMVKKIGEECEGDELKNR